MARAWTRLISALLALAVVGAVVWYVEDQIHTYRAKGNTMTEAALSVIRGSELAPWQQDVMDSLEMSATQVGEGHITQAEISVDRAASVLAAARMRSQSSDMDFFQLAITGLDRIWNQRPDNDGLFQHVTEARIELAMLRVAQKEILPPNHPAPLPPAANRDPDLIPAVHSDGTANAAASPANKGTSANASPVESALAGKHISIGAPRTIAANFTLDPRALGGNYLDATSMPDTSEILLTPASHSLEDNVRVENLTIAGASQTLDAIRWLNVTFVGTRLRYEKGPIDLENVHFIRCTFGFPNNYHGAQLANAIALGQTSFVSE